MPQTRQAKPMVLQRLCSGRTRFPFRLATETVLAHGAENRKSLGILARDPPSSFPVKSPFGIEPPLLKSHEPEPSFSTSIAEALRTPGLEGPIDDPAPSYEVSHSHLYAPPPGPPPGAAMLLGSEPGLHRVSTALSDDVELAYNGGRRRCCE